MADASNLIPLINQLGQTLQTALETGIVAWREGQTQWRMEKVHDIAKARHGVLESARMLDSKGKLRNPNHCSAVADLNPTNADLIQAVYDALEASAEAMAALFLSTGDDHQIRQSINYIRQALDVLHTESPANLPQGAPFSDARTELSKHGTIGRCY